MRVYETIVETLSRKQNRMSEKTFPKLIRDQKDAHQVDKIAKLGKIQSEKSFVGESFHNLVKVSFITCPRRKL